MVATFLSYLTLEPFLPLPRVEPIIARLLSPRGDNQQRTIPQNAATSDLAISGVTPSTEYRSSTVDSVSAQSEVRSKSNELGSKSANQQGAMSVTSATSNLEKTGATPTTDDRLNNRLPTGTARPDSADNAATKPDVRSQSNALASELDNPQAATSQKLANSSLGTISATPPDDSRSDGSAPASATRRTDADDTATKPEVHVQSNVLGSESSQRRYENLDEIVIPGTYKPRDSFRDCAGCPEMVVLPAGSSSIGVVEELAGVRIEVGGLPPFKVTLNYRLALSKTELTMSEYALCEREGHCPRVRTKYTGRYVILELTGQYPVIASWNDAQKYAEWLSRKTGRHYRLPSEVEWEYAARGGTKSAFWYSNEYDASKANSRDSMSINPFNAHTENKPIQVGQYPPNPFGLYDMYGNLAEWVQDCFNIFWSPEDLRAGEDDAVVVDGDVSSITEHPTNGSAYDNSEQCKKWGGTTWGGKKFAYRVYRGGSFEQGSDDFPNSYSRGCLTPSSQEEGIRLAVSLSD
ncbi:MAG TPA: SUMF1/EgtB/PvdO family nonheme iron enzyme [Candidatus Limnocylindrales bacterium]|nr:SUMF1/EgtB/PvdO family nonheme iron enzyme [Candidatus Limnocylindrales bacterium]